MADTSLIFSILAKDRASKTFDKVKGAAKAAFAVGAAAAGAFAVSAVNAASDLAETQSKVGQIFGQSAGDVMAFSKTTASTLGQSRQQALDAAATFGIFGKSAGLAGSDLTGFSTEMVTLAGDMASFNNTTPEAAIQAIGAALRGESEPIRSFGVLLDDATLRNRALKLGLIETTKDALTPQQKVLAAQAEILAQTSDQQGDFARTSDGLANRQRIMAARFADVRAEVGTKLLPVALKLSEWASGAMDWMGQHQTLVRNLAIGVGSFAAAVGAVVVAMKAYRGIMLLVTAATKIWAGLQLVVKGATIVWTAMQWLLNVALTANPIGLIIIAIAALIAIIVLIATKTTWFQTGWKAAWGLIKAVALGVGRWFMDTLWRKWILGTFNNITGAAASMREKVVSLFTSMRDKLLGAASKLRSGFAKVAGWLTAPFRAGFNAISSLWNRTLGRVSFTIPRWVPLGLGGKGWSFPQMPRLAQGGIVTRPTVAMVGEAGPEAVVPLRRGGGGAMGGTTVIRFEADGSRTSQLLLELMREVVRVRGGGNVQVAFGRR